MYVRVPAIIFNEYSQITCSPITRKENALCQHSASILSTYSKANLPNHSTTLNPHTHAPTLTHTQTSTSWIVHAHKVKGRLPVSVPVPVPVPLPRSCTNRTRSAALTNIQIHI